MDGEIEKIVKGYKIFKKNVVQMPHEYWTVKEAIHDLTKEKFIIKSIKTNTLKMKPYLKSIISNETSILAGLDHPSIIKLKEEIRTSNNLYLVNEYCESSLQGLIDRLGEGIVIDPYYILTQLMNAFRYLNNKHIIHGNLKPESILFKNGKIKLNNFGYARKKGLAKDFDTEYLLCGNIKYASVEILDGTDFTEKTDVWSLGTIVFELYSKRHPYCDGHKKITREKLSKNIKRNRFPDLMNKEVKELLSGMLCPLESNRFTWEQVFNKFDSLETQHFEFVSDVFSTEKFHSGDSEEVQKNDLELRFLNFLKRKRTLAFFLSRTVRLISNMYKDQQLNKIPSIIYVRFIAFSVLLMNREFTDIRFSLENDKYGKLFREHGVSNFENLRKKTIFNYEISNAKECEQKSSKLFDDLTNEMEKNLKNDKFDKVTEFKVKKQASVSVLHKDFQINCRKIFSHYKKNLDSVSESALNLLYSMHLILIQLDYLRIFDRQNEAKDFELSNVSDRVRDSRKACINEICERNL